MKKDRVNFSKSQDARIAATVKWFETHGRNKGLPQDFNDANLDDFWIEITSATLTSGVYYHAWKRKLRIDNGTGTGGGWQDHPDGCVSGTSPDTRAINTAGTQVTNGTILRAIVGLNSSGIATFTVTQEAVSGGTIVVSENAFTLTPAGVLSGGIYLANTCAATLSLSPGVHQMTGNSIHTSPSSSTLTNAAAGFSDSSSAYSPDYYGGALYIGSAPYNGTFEGPRAVAFPTRILDNRTNGLATTVYVLLQSYFFKGSAGSMTITGQYTVTDLA